MMLSKLFKGELGLGITFWKFGILGLIICKLAVRLFGSLLASHLKGMTIVGYFMRGFHPIYSSKFSILWTLCYLSSLLIMFFYSWNILLAVWRSSANYDKSVWLSQLARLSMIVFIAVIWGSVNFRPFF